MNAATSQRTSSRERLGSRPCWTMIPGRMSLSVWVCQDLPGMRPLKEAASEETAISTTLRCWAAQGGAVQLNLRRISEES